MTGTLIEPQRTCPNHPGEDVALEGLPMPFYALHGARHVEGADKQPQQLSPTAQMPIGIWRCRRCGYLQLQDRSQQFPLQD